MSSFFLSESTSQVFELIDRVQASIASLRVDAPQKLTAQSSRGLTTAGATLEFIREQVPKAIKDCLDRSRRVMEIVTAMKVFTHPGTNSYVHASINDLVSTTVSKRATAGILRGDWS